MRFEIVGPNIASLMGWARQIIGWLVLLLCFGGLMGAPVAERLDENVTEIANADGITGDSYFIPQALGDFSRGRYNGLLVPSARQPGTSHLIQLEAP